MIVRYIAERHFPSRVNSVARTMIHDHNEWILNAVDKLKRDTMAVFNVSNVVVYNKWLDVHADKPYFKQLDDGVGLVNYFFTEPYPADKQNNRFILTPNTFAVLYFSHFDSDLMYKRKMNIVRHALMRTLTDVHGEGAVKWADDKDARESPAGAKVSRNDVLINGKKCAGMDAMAIDGRLDVSVGIQNEFAARDKKIVHSLLASDPHWGKSVGKSEGIAGAKMSLPVFLQNLQSAVDDVYAG